MTQTSIVPALPSIESDLNTNAVGATSLVSVLFVSGAVTVGVFGRLGDMFGKRRLIVLQLVIAIGGLIVCALAHTLTAMLVGRALVGCMAGIFPLAFSSIRDHLAFRPAATAIAVIAGIAAGGGACGQIFGGLITDSLGYRWIFWLSALGFTVAALVTHFLLPESSLRTGGRVDVLGAVLLAIGVGAPLFAISQASSWGWGDPRIVLLLCSVLLVAPVFIWHERRTIDPLLSLPTLLLPQVRITNLAAFLIGFGMFGTSAIVSQFVQTPTSSGYGFGASATGAALFLVPGTTVMLFASPSTGWVTHRAGAKTSLLLGCVFGFVGLTGMALVNGSPFLVYIWIVLMYAGLAGTFGVLPLLILQAVPPELRGQSTGVNLILRTIGTAIGLQLAGTLVASSTEASGVPAESGFTYAFLLDAAAVGMAFVLAALFLPRFKTGAEDERAAEPLVASGAT
jgi:MFS family permease